MVWKYETFIKKGTSHEKKKIPCQDFIHTMEDDNGLAVALADGLGSLPNSHIAAEIATKETCSWLMREAEKLDSSNFEAESTQFRQNLVSHLRKCILTEARQKGLQSSSMDCTLVFVYISKEKKLAVIGQLGDSAICIMTQTDPVALNESGAVANGTRAILDLDAAECMRVYLKDLEQCPVLGFILTSDGMEKELYIKGADQVRKKAEQYFNALQSDQEEPAKVLEKLVDEVTKDPYGGFDDDISIAVISCAEEKISLDENPTWLCTCGARNQLQDTYCSACGADFLKCYHNIRFQDYGGKYAYFRKLNKNEQMENQILNPDAEESDAAEEKQEECAAPAEPVAAQIPVKKPEKKRSCLHMIAAGLAGVVAGGLIFGYTTAMYSSSDTDYLTEQFGQLQQQLVDTRGQLDQMEKLLQDLERLSEQDQLAVLPDGSAYWGGTENGLPDGIGVQFAKGSYYVGPFSKGARHGQFCVVEKADPSNSWIEAYDHGNRTDRVRLKDYFFSCDTQKLYIVSVKNSNMLEQPGEKEIIRTLDKGEPVLRTMAQTKKAKSKEWVQIQTKQNETGWILLEDLIRVLQ